MKFEKKVIGNTVLGQEIESWVLPLIHNATKILIIGGVHGDEEEGIEIAESILKTLSNDSININLVIVPCLNKDGQVHNLRSNINRVDLNRNLPTNNWSPSYNNPRYNPGKKPASEPETQAFMSLINSYKPNLIISLHSFSESLILYAPGTGEFDQNTRQLALNLDLKLVPKMSYDVTGSLNTLANERKIPTITIEAPRDNRWPQVRPLFINELITFIRDIK